MNGWNRLFVVAAVLWAIAAPFVLIEDANKPLQQAFDMCADAAYRNCGSSDSQIRFNMDKYHDEVRLCLAGLNIVSIQKVLSAMIGIGDRTLGLVAWGFILRVPRKIVFDTDRVRPRRER